MNYIGFNFQREIFCFIIFITLINSANSYLAFKYPHAFKLNNRNIFVIHELGITICDETFTESIDRVVTFSESEQINSDSALSKVTSVNADYYIICLINDKIYIFNEEGYFLRKSSNLITSLSVEYYTLEYIAIQSDYLYFIIGFISDAKLYLYSYKYQISDKTIYRFGALENTNYYNIKNNGLSCHFMKYLTSSYEYTNLITCLYTATEGRIAFEFFDITTTSLYKSSTKSKTAILTQREVRYIKATIFNDRKKLLVGWITSGRVPYYWMYDMILIIILILIQ